MEKVYYILIATGEPLQRSYQHPNKLAKYDDGKWFIIVVVFLLCN
jgi:hypothetical protein